MLGVRDKEKVSLGLWHVACIIVRVFQALKCVRVCTSGQYERMHVYIFVCEIKTQVKIATCMDIYIYMFDYASANQCIFKCLI